MLTLSAFANSLYFSNSALSIVDIGLHATARVRNYQDRFRGLARRVFLLH